MANFILGYIVIGLLFSFLYIWKTGGTETIRPVNEKRELAGLCFTTAMITLLWLPIGLFAIITVSRARTR